MVCFVHLRLTKLRAPSIYLELARPLTFSFSEMLFAVSRTLTGEQLSFPKSREPSDHLEPVGSLPLFAVSQGLTGEHLRPMNQCASSDHLEPAHWLSRLFSAKFACLPREACLRGVHRVAAQSPPPSPRDPRPRVGPPWAPNDTVCQKPRGFDIMYWWRFTYKYQKTCSPSQCGINVFS